MPVAGCAYADTDEASGRPDGVPGSDPLVFGGPPDRLTTPAFPVLCKWASTDKHGAADVCGEEAELTKRSVATMLRCQRSRICQAPAIGLHADDVANVRVRRAVALDTSRRQLVMRPYSFNRCSGDIRRPIEGIWPPAMPAGQGAVGVAVMPFDLEPIPDDGDELHVSLAASSACASGDLLGDTAGQPAGDHLRSASAWKCSSAAAAGVVIRQAAGIERSIGRSPGPFPAGGFGTIEAASVSRRATVCPRRPRVKLRMVGNPRR